MSLFNVFLHEKREKEAAEQTRRLKLAQRHRSQARSKYPSDLTKHTEINAEAQKNYRKRVGNFIVKMIDKPIRVHDEYSEQAAFKVTARGSTDDLGMSFIADGLQQESYFGGRSQSYNPNASIQRSIRESLRDDSGYATNKGLQTISVLRRRSETAENSRQNSCDPARRTNQGWRFGSFRTSAERAAHQEHANAVLDGVPTALCNGNTPEALMNLRERHASLDLSGAFRFQCGDYFEKVKQSLESRVAGVTFR
jgi:hypothetical protein